MAVVPLSETTNVETCQYIINQSEMSIIACNSITSKKLSQFICMPLSVVTIFLANCPTIKVVILLDIYLADKPKDLFPDEIQVYTLEEVCRSLSPPFCRSFPASLRTTPSTPSSTLVLLLMPTLPAARKATASAAPLSFPST